MTDWRVPASEIPQGIAELLAARGAAQRNLYRALSNAPEMVEAWASFIWALRDEPATSRRLRELVILRTAVRHASPYEWHHHVAMARHAGLSQEEVAGVPNWREAGCFGDDEQAALALADGVCDCSVSEATAGRALGHFGHKGYVELCLTAAAYSMVPRVLNALGVPLEEPPDGVSAPWEAQPDS